jgi:hypothetical protein
MGDSENHRVIPVQFIDYRRGELAHDETPALLVEPKSSAVSALPNSTNSPVSF